MKSADKIVRVFAALEPERTMCIRGRLLLLAHGLADPIQNDSVPTEGWLVVPSMTFPSIVEATQSTFPEWIERSTARTNPQMYELDDACVCLTFTILLDHRLLNTCTVNIQCSTAASKWLSSRIRK